MNESIYFIYYLCKHFQIKREITRLIFARNSKTYVFQERTIDMNDSAQNYSNIAFPQAQKRTNKAFKSYDDFCKNKHLKV